MGVTEMKSSGVIWLDRGKLFKYDEDGSVVDGIIDERSSNKSGKERRDGLT